MCALNFDPSPYLQLYQQRREAENQPPPWANASQNIMSGLDLLLREKRQRELMDMEREKLNFSRNQQLFENENKYGKDPTGIDIGVQGGIGQSSFMPGSLPRGVEGPQPAMKMGTNMPLVEALNKFRAGGLKPSPENAQLMPYLGQEERNKYYENANPKPVAQYVIPTYDEQGNVISTTPLPPGQKPFGGGKPTVTPGQRLDAKRMDMQPKEKALLDNALSKFDAMIAEAEAIKNHPSLGTATGMSSFMGSVPGTGAKNVASRMETLKSKTAFNILQEMRQNSPTGGALGNISDRENQLLAENIASLDRGQSEVDVSGSLDRVIDYARGAKQRLKQAYDDYYGGKTSGHIIQRNKRTGQLRESFDGGKTWQTR